jgi:pimeloyl-ACP methyl ester carboxylesterase
MIFRNRAATPALAVAAGTCHAALVASGTDLDGYRTEALADDIEDLRKALGYDKKIAALALRSDKYGAPDQRRAFLDM